MPNQKTRRVPLEAAEIASPCSASWEAMSGDDRVRFCHACRLHVYNLSGMSRDEAEALVAEREGRLCVRLLRRADGTVLTRDCPIGLRAVRRRLAKIAAALAAMLTFAVCGLAVGQRSAPASGSATGPLQRILQWCRPQPAVILMGAFCYPPDIDADVQEPPLDESP